MSAYISTYTTQLHGLCDWQFSLLTVLNPDTLFLRLKYLVHSCGVLQRGGGKEERRGEKGGREGREGRYQQEEEREK